MYSFATSSVGLLDGKKIEQKECQRLSGINYDGLAGWLGNTIVKAASQRPLSGSQKNRLFP